MPKLLRLASLAACLGMALLPAHAPAADSDTELEARIAAMGRIGSAGGGQAGGQAAQRLHKCLPRRPRHCCEPIKCIQKKSI